MRSPARTPRRDEQRQVREPLPDPRRAQIRIAAQRAPHHPLDQQERREGNDEIRQPPAQHLGGRRRRQSERHVGKRPVDQHEGHVAEADRRRVERGEEDQVEKGLACAQIGTRPRNRRHEVAVHPRAQRLLDVGPAPTRVGQRLADLVAARAPRQRFSYEPAQFLVHGISSPLLTLSTLHRIPDRVNYAPKLPRRSAFRPIPSSPRSLRRQTHQ